MDLKNTVISLSEVCGASGSETPAAELALNMLRNYCPDAHIQNGSVIGNFGSFSDSKQHLVIDAHIDQIGFIVTNITDDGFIKIGNIGGIDRRLLPAQPVVIHGKHDIKGVICSVPPHLTDGCEVLSFDDTAIDTGYSQAELREIVSLGDSITFDVKCRELLNDRLTGGALDDRCGIAAVLYALELIKSAETAYNVTVVFSSQEEIGERGAKTAAFAVDADIALAVDVSFAYAIGEDENMCGYLGKGAMIGVSPSLSRRISQKLMNIARKADIPCQTEVMNELTSTNADRYSVSRCGVEACTISIPLRNMHTPVEVIDMKDIELTGRLIAEFIREAE